MEILDSGVSMRALFLLFSLALVIGGCSKPAPEVDPVASTTTPAPRPSPTATLPTMPDAAREFSNSGAANFTQYWIDVVNYSNATGNTDLLSAISGKSCVGCDLIIEKIADTYGAGGYFRGNDWVLKEVRIDNYGREALVMMDLRTLSGEVRHSAETEPKSVPKKSAEFYGVVRFKNDRWIMKSFGAELAD